LIWLTEYLQDGLESLIVVTFLDPLELLWTITANEQIEDAFNEQTEDGLVTWWLIPIRMHLVKNMLMD